MSDQNTPEPTPNDLVDELRSLGDNLREMFASAWNSAERQRLQQDLEEGLADLKNSLNRATDEFQSSPTGQTIKEELADLNERLHTGEVEATVRREVLNALRLANDGLKKAAEHIKTPPSS
jgi:ElaB/YqjD/DUF883 family membrane-anchored ribosome-binding protein